MTTKKNQVEKFNDDRLRKSLRKPWVEFLRLDTEKDCQVVAQHFFGNYKATVHSFAAATRGINLMDYNGCYMEIGGTQAPEGPLLPGPVYPVLAFRMSRSRSTVRPYRFKLDGFYRDGKKRAWVKTDTWEKLLGDDSYFEEHIIGGKPIDDRMRIR